MTRIAARRSAAAMGALLLAASCGGGGDEGLATSAGAGAQASTSASISSATSPDVSSTTTTTSSASSGGAGGAGGAPAVAGLVLPRFVDLPYVVAGAGGSQATLVLTNSGDAELGGPNGGPITMAVAGDATITSDAAPTSIAAGASANVAVHFAGASAETIASATITITTALGTATIPAYAVAGDPELGQGNWEQVAMPQGLVAGAAITVAMPTAPFPDGTGSWDDPSVQIFVPDGYRERGAQDLVLHFHGFDATVAETVVTHPYREELYASGANDVLVVPQGPVNASSGDFGKLMQPGGLSALAREVLVVLYREGKIEAPALGELALTSHSGGYAAVAFNLDPSNGGPDIRQVDLFDSLYGYLATYEGYATAPGHWFRSDYTTSGGTLADNQQAASDLASAGLDVAEDDGNRSLLAAGPVIFYSDTSHDDSTRVDMCFGEELRWAAHHSRSGPRVELRSVVASGGVATVRWLSPADDDLTGFSIETSTDGVTFTSATVAAPNASDATIPITGGARVRVVPIATGVTSPLASDVYRVDDGATILVVDGFDRVLGGGYGALSHDFAALVGEAAGAVATVSHRAITEDAFDLSPYATVIWSLGDQSTLDHALTSAEQAAILAYLTNGGHLVASGSELGYDLDASSDGAAFLSSAFGLAYAADASGSDAVSGTGALASVASFTFSSASGPYQVAYPDVYSEDGGDVLLEYGNGKIAAVGIAHRAAAVGFPLELVDDPAARSALAKALVAFVGP